MVDGREAETLSDAYRMTWRLQSAARLLTGETLDMEAVGEGGRAFLCRSNEVDTMDDLAAAIDVTTHAAAQMLDAILARPVP